MEEKHADFASLLKPINSVFESVPTENFVSTEEDFDAKMLDECGCKEVHA